MQNWPDQDLDNLFKRAAEKSEGDAVMPDWTDMQLRLEKADQELFFRRSTGIISGSILVIATAVLMWQGLITQSPEEALHAPAQPPHNTLRREPAESKIQFNPDQFVSKAERLPTLRTQPEAKNIKTTASKAAKRVEPQLSAAGHDVGLTGFFIKDEPRKTGNNPITGRQFAATGNASGSTDDVIPESSDPSDSSSMEEKALHKLEYSVARQVEVPSENEAKSKKNCCGFSIKFAVSPDYSTVKSVRPGKMGFNYGLLVEYAISKRLSVASGLVRSNKFYSARNVEYNGQPSDWVDGRCYMWDVPVMAYYHFSHGRKWSLYAGAGVSSYLMSEERYVYQVRAGYGNVYTYEQTIRGKNNEWFSVLNFSVGLNRKLNSQWAVQLEPFFKAPLAGVGEGGVSLASLGAFLNIKYSFSPIIDRSP